METEAVTRESMLKKVAYVRSLVGSTGGEKLFADYP